MLGKYIMNLSLFRSRIQARHCTTHHNRKPAGKQSSVILYTFGRVPMLYPKRHANKARCHDNLSTQKASRQTETNKMQLLSDHLIKHSIAVVWLVVVALLPLILALGAKQGAG